MESNVFCSAFRGSLSALTIMHSAISRNDSRPRDHQPKVNVGPKDHQFMESKKL